MKKKILYSSHIFLFPFRWKISNINYPVKYGINKLNNIAQYINPQFWNSFKFEFKDSHSYNTYNEYAYFYPHVRDVLGLDIHNENPAKILQYEYNITENAEYVIQLKKNVTFELKIEDILLTLFPEGIGVFVFLLNNHGYSLPKDILLINDYGRRVFPQFLGNTGVLSDAPKGSFLADKIILRNIQTEFGMMVEEDFSYYNSYENIRNKPFRLPAHIGKLLGKSFYHDTNIHNEIEIEPVLDDRMFTISVYYNNPLIKTLSKWEKNKDYYRYEKDEFWYKYIFIDGEDISIHSRGFIKKLLKSATYDRWIEYPKNEGHIFGISRYSFMILAADTWFTKNVILSHVKFLYFQMVLLSLVQRSYLIHFSTKVARISHNIKRGILKFSQIRKEINELYLDYIKFVNRIYFREVTAQEQGIELYDLIQEKMRIERDVKDLDREIQELNEYLETQEAVSLNRMANWFLPVALLSGILGMNTLDMWNKAVLAKDWKNIDWQFTILLFVSTFTVLWAIYALIKYWNIKNIWNNLKNKIL